MRPPSPTSSSCCFDPQLLPCPGLKIKARHRPQPFLSLTNATFRLGDRLAFPDTSWTFNRNEHWAILGPNGSGKSLLGDALRGKLPLVAGELTYHFKPP